MPNRYYSVVEAVQVTPDNLDEIAEFTNGRVELATVAGPGRGVSPAVRVFPPELRVPGFPVRMGDWVTRDHTGCIRTVRASTFQAVYQPVEED